MTEREKMLAGELYDCGGEWITNSMAQSNV